MLLERGTSVCPECKLLPVFCHSCKTMHYAEETIAISMFRDKENGGVELVQFLVCYACATTRPDCGGSA